MLRATIVLASALLTEAAVLSSDERVVTSEELRDVTVEAAAVLS